MFPAAQAVFVVRMLARSIAAVASSTGAPPAGLCRLIAPSEAMDRRFILAPTGAEILLLGLDSELLDPLQKAHVPGSVLLPTPASQSFV